MSESITPVTDSPVDLLQSVRSAAVNLVEQMQKLRAVQPETTLPLWNEYITTAQELVHFLCADSAPVAARSLPMTLKQRREFGRLLRDKRNAAGYSRVQLARRAQLSDATIKFIETAHHPPSRATLIRLINVEQLQLCWADVPGQRAPPKAATGEPRNRYLETISNEREPVRVVIDRLDFDELGDPVHVLRLLVEERSRSGDEPGAETKSATGREKPQVRDLFAGIDFIPRRR